MTQEPQAAIQERLSRLEQIIPALAQAWPALALELEARRARFVDLLIASDDEQRRGRIKELSDLLELPKRLQEERTRLQLQAKAELL